MKKAFIIITVMMNCLLYKAQSNLNSGINHITKQNAESIVGFLASDAMRGREAGSSEAKIAAEFIISQLREAGIAPLGNSYIQPFEAIQTLSKKNARWHAKPDSVSYYKQKGIFRRLNLQNVFGVIPGKNQNEIVIVGAHYDHLGIDEKIPDDGIFNGADDNASGVSAVLQIANAFVKDGKKPNRTIIFAFWDGEEKDLLGSQYFTAVFPEIKKVKSYLNFDMVGRNNDENKPKHVVFFYTAANPAFGKWLKEDVKKYNLQLEPDYRAWDKPVGGSDNGSFAQVGIPILWYHTDAHPDYHKPTDTPEKLNWNKLVDITKAAYLNAWKMANEKNY